MSIYRTLFWGFRSTDGEKYTCQRNRRRRMENTIRLCRWRLEYRPGEKSLAMLLHALGNTNKRGCGFRTTKLKGMKGIFTARCPVSRTSKINQNTHHAFFHESPTLCWSAVGARLDVQMRGSHPALILVLYLIPSNMQITDSQRRLLAFITQMERPQRLCRRAADPQPTHCQAMLSRPRLRHQPLPAH